MGCGIDISKLSPRGSKVNNTAKETSGSVSFMDLYSLVTELIGQNGRRGALMISIDCTHPDLEEFISVKSDLDRVTKANISIRITNDFMQAVKDDKDWELKFKRKETNEVISKTVKAKDLYNKFCKMNWDMAEPGMLFWDNIEQYNLLSNTKDFKYEGTNPCAEEPLPAGGSCLLGSINLNSFVKNGEFDFQDLNNTVEIATKALNDVLDEGLSLHPLKEQRDSVRDWRQIGLGIMGLADMLINLKLEYGTQESIDLCDKIAFNIANTAINTSALIAKETSPFPKCVVKNIISTDFFKKNTDNRTKKLVETYGLANSQLLTIAPTGSISTMLQISGGIEPIFANYYIRKTQSLHGKEVNYKVYTPIVDTYMKDNNIEDDSLLPHYFITSQNLEYHNRIDMQSVWQSHIDASISSTVNLPHETTIEEVEKLYLYAWDKKLKGITIYRDGCKRSGVLITDDSEDNNENNNEIIDFPRGVIEDVPEGLSYRKYKLKTGCGSLYLFLGIAEEEGKIYDCFTNTDGVGGCTINTQANSRLVSACLRGGIPVEYIIEQLNKSGTCPSFTYKRGKGEKLSDGKSCSSAIANVLKSVMKEFSEEKEKNEDFKENIKTDSKVETKMQKCPECGEYTLVFEGGCNSCRNCGYSKCS